MSLQFDNTIELLQATGCTAGNLQLYNDVQHSIECAIASEGTNVGPLGQSVLLAEKATQPPISCMVDLITGSASECDTEIPSDKRTAAFNAFTEVTNFRPVNVGTVFAEISDEQRELINMTAFYIFFPVFALALIAIWFMVGFNWIPWPVGLLLSILTFIILYGFSMLYRIQVENFLVNQNQQWQNNAAAIQSNFANSIAYWPQGLFAVACAVTSTGGTGWTCNEIGNELDIEAIDCANCRFREPVPKLCGPVKIESKQPRKRTRKQRIAE